MKCPMTTKMADVSIVFGRHVVVVVVVDFEMNCPMRAKVAAVSIVFGRSSAEVPKFVETSAR